MLVTLNILLILNKREIWASEGNFLMVGQRLCPIWIVLSNFTRSRRFKIYAYLEGYMRLLADFDVTRIGYVGTGKPISATTGNIFVKLTYNNS